MKFTISGDKSKLGIDVVTRKYPQSDYYLDVNWLTCKINVEIPGYSASFYGEIFADEISGLFNQLKEMSQQNTDYASLEMRENYIRLEAKKDQLGHIQWNVSTTYPPNKGATLTFKMNSDKTYLSELLREMEQVVQKFPVIEGKH
ncbi:WapI family immunity protein [Tepidibacillus fermentans]|uniref:Uncharacterized protein n=1 Tax=Tepidibacillus fermentans TaxID=1281767 RepID=A0A4R3KDC5_9BACI|nr:hypothetical protein [Tepidibacillus fermentans]TCS81040.1 hypothetical protein EDD72_11417 [Tepidibacillus fermentans]